MGGVEVSCVRCGREFLLLGEVAATRPLPRHELPERIPGSGPVRFRQSGIVCEPGVDVTQVVAW